MKHAWVMLVAWCLLAVYLGVSAYYATSTLVTMFLTVGAVSAMFDAYNYGRKIHEHRRAERDREPAHPGAAYSPTASILARRAGLAAAGVTRPADPDEGTGEDTRLVLPERTDTTPVLATKYARLVWMPGDHYLFVGTGVGKSTQFGIRSKAQCVMTDHGDGGEHNAPDENCQCGFYAMAQGHHEPLRADLIEIEVELGGRTIVGDYGYRAEWQRILKVLVPKLCFTCDDKADVLVVANEHRGAHQVLPFCRKDVAPEYRVLNIEQISYDLGVPVEWRPWD